LILDLIEKADRTVTIDDLAAKTGFTKQKVRGITYRLKNAKKIKTEKRGTYSKV
jgi:DNA-binding IclR family transcriptional regulator